MSYTRRPLCVLSGLVDVDIKKDNEFKEANQVFIAQYVKRERLAKTNHKPAIDDEDVKRVCESGVFYTNKPATLQNKVFFEIILFFCRRGRQNLRQLKKKMTLRQS